jgi:hypothetical protein
MAGDCSCARTCALDQQDRLADALHDAGDQRMHGLDACHHVDLCRYDRRARSAQERQQQNSSERTAVKGSHRILPE